MLEKKRNYSGIYFLLVFCSATFSYLLTVLGYFPFLGLSIFFLALATLVFIFKKKRTAYDLALYLLTCSVALFICLRANPFLTFLNFCAVCFLGSWLALESDGQNSFINLIFSPLNLVAKTLQTKSKYKFDLSRIKLKNKKIEEEKIKSLIVSSLITLLILTVVLPLLSYANPLFKDLVINFLNLFDLRKFWQKFLEENFFLYSWRIVIFLIFLVLMPRMLSWVNKRKEVKPAAQFIRLDHLLIPKIVLGIVLIVFFITQTQLYFASEEVLKNLGYSHSQYAREVFGHLSVVSLIIFGLIYNDKKKQFGHKITTWFLILEGIFLNSIALKSVYDYSSRWGFTYKRLYGYGFVIWIYGILLLFAFKYLKKQKKLVFLYSLSIFSSLLLLAINLANFDYLIYHRHQPRTGQGIDYRYLSILSSDSQSLLENLEILVEKIEETQNDKKDKEFINKINIAGRLKDKIIKTRKKYKNLPWQSFNFSEYRQYQQVKDFDLEEFGNRIHSASIDSPTENNP